MDDHDTYRYVVTADDLDDADRRELEDRIERLLDEEGDVRVEPAPDDRLELVVPDRIPTRTKPEVRAAVDDVLPYSPDRHERFILELHVNWPSTRYRICVDFE